MRHYYYPIQETLPLHDEREQSSVTLMRKREECVDEACQRQVKLHERVCSGSCRCDNGALWVCSSTRLVNESRSDFLSDNTEKERNTPACYSTSLTGRFTSGETHTHTQTSTGCQEVSNVCRVKAKSDFKWQTRCWISGAVTLERPCTVNHACFFKANSTEYNRILSKVTE